jgi:hypothetical protein
MSAWTLIIGVAVVLVVWFVAKHFYFDPAERDQNAAIRESMEQQAQKRNGRVELSSRQPILYVPTKHGDIQLSVLITNDETYREHTYARFKLEHVAEKHFVVLLKSDNLLLKPLPIGTRVELADERFNDQFVVAGNDSEFVETLLSADIRDKLRTSSLQVSFGRRTDALLLDRERGWLSVQTQFLQTGDEIFDSLIDTAILFQERFAEVAAAKPRFTNT